MAAHPFLRHGLFVLLACACPARARADDAKPVFRAGAFAVDVTPEKFPVIVNGGFFPVVADKAHDKLHAQWIVLDDGKGTRIGLCVVDSLMMPRELLDDAKRQIETATGLRPDQVMISATHTHSAPSVMGCLGSDADPEYPKFLLGKLVEGARRAVKNLAPAKVGHASVQLPQYTHTRQWVYRPDRMLRDPFGELTVRANMHPGYQNAAVVGPTGPSDPELSVLAFQSAEGWPIAVLANYSMHYFGAAAVSSDYFGLFCEKLARKITPQQKSDAPPFVAVMSQGTSGDQHWMDYGAPEKKVTMDAYAGALAAAAHEAYQSIQFRADVDLAMAEKDIRVGVRAPDEKRLAWARGVVAKLKDGKPTNLTEIYAREAVFLHEKPSRDVKLQAVRVGPVGIAAIPCEVFALTGLKIKARSLLRPTFNIELANGADGYIPPPELHPLGGYTTWPARTACLEVEAEGKIVDAVLGLLEGISAGWTPPRAGWPGNAYVVAMKQTNPVAFWRGDAMAGDAFSDDVGEREYEPGVLPFLDGLPAGRLASHLSYRRQPNRCAHFAGGRLRAKLPQLGGTYSVSFWFWNGLPNDARPVTAYLFSRGPDGDKEAAGDHLGVGGTHAAQGRLLFFNGNRLNKILAGGTLIQPKTWNHVALVRDGKEVRVYLNGKPDPEISGEAEPSIPHDTAHIFLGGRNDNFANLEGKIDEVAVYDRALKGEEASALFQAAGPITPSPGTPGEGRGGGPSSIGNRKSEIGNSKDPLPSPPPEYRERGQSESRGLRPDPPKSPDEALASIKVKEGFEVDLVASEPLTSSPVAISWGSDGKLWVAEMADYPYGVSGDMTKRGGSKVRFLEDADGDGKYDKSAVFMDNVHFPTGVLAWRKGVIVTAAPEIFYAEDTNGDGKADRKEVLYSGFTEGNPQLRVNGLRWGLDSWVYLANGWSSKGKVKSHKTGVEVQVDGRDIRIRPDTGEIETESGMSEFGRDPDDWGNWFGCDNSHPMWHFVLSDRYTRRNAHVAAPDPREQLMKPFPPRVFPISKAEKRYHGGEYAGYFQSACAATVYRDELLFGPEERGPATQHAFVCDPVHNLVHHEIMKATGVTFTAKRPEDEKSSEFLASTDSWFRPVMTLTGPDGALWVVDMYRFMIEHPDWLPQAGKDELRPFYRLGEERGRIYRVYSKGRKPRQVPRMDKWRTIELCRAAMDSPSGWQRDMAQMLLLWNRDRMVGEARGELQGVVYGSQNPLARLQALCTLDGLGVLGTEVLMAALRDEDAMVRRQAVRLSESRAKAAPELLAAATKGVADPDAKVRLQLACSLGEWDGPEAAAALAQLAVKDAGDPYVAAAVMSSAVKHFPALVDAALKSNAASSAPLRAHLLDMALARNDRDAAAKLLEPVVAGSNVETFARFVEAVRRKNQTLKQLADAKPGDALSKRLADAAKVVAAARVAVSDKSADSARRAAAAALLGWIGDPATAAADKRRLAELLSFQTPADVQAEAVRAVGRIGGDDVAALLLSKWPGVSPEVRGAIADVLLSGERPAIELLNAVAAGAISPADLDTPRRQRLLHSGSEKIKALAQKVLGAPAETSRQKVVEAMRPVLEMKGDAKRGKVVFAQHCAVCHQLRDVGQEVGPPLLGMAGAPGETLLAHVLDPNRQVEPKYVGYNATLSGGEVVFGVITSETGNSITMKGLDGKARDVLRTELKSMASTNRSLMPDGFESGMSKQELADVIRFMQAPDEAK